LLIKPYSNLSNVLPPIGLGYLSSFLKKEGISSKILMNGKKIRIRSAESIIEEMSFFGSQQIII
jgi:hypothetical protein